MFTANSSLSNVEYFCSAAENFWQKNASGCSDTRLVVLEYTAPTAISFASVVKGDVGIVLRVVKQCCSSQC